MGAWGAGNFQNDDALDAVGELLDRLSEEVTTLAEGDLRIDEKFDEVVAKVDLIRAVSSYSGAASPRPKQVAAWRDKCLAVFDEQFDRLDPAPGFKEERRTVIVSTFDELLKLSGEFWKQ